MESQDFLKIISAEIKNFQLLEHTKVDIAGKSIAIIGKNGGGKSSFLRAIQSPLDAKFRPERAIKEGEERASVFLKLAGKEAGEDVEYTYSVVFTDKNKKGNISVKDADGNDIKSRDIQKSIIGNISFNIDDFIKMGLTEQGKPSVTGIAKQVEVLRQFLTKEERISMNTIDADIESIKAKRKELKVEADTLVKQAKEIQFTEFEMEEYSVDKSAEIEKVKSEMANLQEAIKNWNRVSQGTTQASNRAKELESYAIKSDECEFILNELNNIDVIGKVNILPVDEAMELIEKAKSKLKQYVDTCKTNEPEYVSNLDKASKGESWLENNPEPNISDLSNKLSELMKHQEMHVKINSVNEKWVKSRRLTEEYDSYAKELERLKAEKQKIFSSGSLPVKGLEFSEEEGVTFNGLPFNQDHHPTSTILSIGAKVAMAMNPNLKCIFIKDGSMFDKKTLSGLLKYIEDNGYQLLIEMVDFSGEKEVSIEFTEEYL